MKKTGFIFAFFTIAFFCYAETPPEVILSEGRLTESVMMNFLQENNPELDIAFARNVIRLYISEAEYEGVNHDIAFAQMCWHTEYLSFTKTFARADSNNFCGLSSLYSRYSAYIFDTIETGVRAHIQHLKGYATADPLGEMCVDPRYTMISEEYGLGSSPEIDGLSYRWGGADYAQQIKRILARIYSRYPEF